MAAFLVFEGGELSGKSTQANLLYHRMIDSGLETILVKEPGTTRIGEYLRDYLISNRPLSYETEFLLFAAARAELVKTAIKPALQKGLNIISDRFMYSSVAYQGYGRKLDLEAIDYINHFAIQGCVPDLVIFLDMPPSDSLKRLGAFQERLPLAPEPKLRVDQEARRKFENMSLKFHEKLRKGFHTLANKDPHRWLVLDGNDAIESIADKVWERVQTLIA